MQKLTRCDEIITITAEVSEVTRLSFPRSGQSLGLLMSAESVGAVEWVRRLAPSCDGDNSVGVNGNEQ